jgi:hypothetical protein
MSQTSETPVLALYTSASNGLFLVKSGAPQGAIASAHQLRMSAQIGPVLVTPNDAPRRRMNPQFAMVAGVLFAPMIWLGHALLSGR